MNDRLDKRIDEIVAREKNVRLMRLERRAAVALMFFSPDECSWVYRPNDAPFDPLLGIQVEARPDP